MKNLKQSIALDNPFRLLYHKAMAVLANVRYGFPSRGMVIIGVTGTNGKTTTANIIGKGLVEAGEKVFMFTTVNYIIDGKEYQNKTKMTSPDASTLQKLLKEAKKAGCKYAVIETASHGIAMSRNWGLDYDVAVLTNISQDHLDLHGTMEKYVNTKLKLFKSLIRSKRKPGVKKTAIINLDSDYQKIFAEETYDSMITYGVYSDSANLKATGVENKPNGTRFHVAIPGENLDINTKLMGDFNIYNITAAIGVFIALGIKSENIHKIVEHINPVPGRLEFVENNEGFRIYVDYAHTADALDKVLNILGEHKGEGKLITVFGATGDRDKSKRPIMGSIVSKHSDIVFLTQDDDYTEVTENIIKDVLPGIERKEGENFWVISDRGEAIRTALLSANKGDTILVAGKGDEHILVTNEGPKDWHDRTFIEGILTDIDENKMMS